MKPLVLLTNDDGINSHGLQIFKTYLEKYFEVYTIAPLVEKSTTSHSLSLSKPLHLTTIDNKTFALDGFPADCTYIGLFKVLPRKPDLVISGINKGANIGQDVFYSGTIAGARQAVLNGVSGIACSLTYKAGEIPLWKEASLYLTELINNIYPQIVKTKKLININYPNVAEVKGLKVVPFGERFYTEEVISNIDPRGNGYHWVGGDYKGFKHDPNSDCTAIEEGFVSLTPVAMNATDFSDLTTLDTWVSSIKINQNYKNN